MRVIVAIVLILASISAYSAEINCYSKNQRIYHGYGNDIVYDRDYIAFMETKSHHLILISADCIVMARVNKGEKIYTLHSDEILNQKNKH